MWILFAGVCFAGTVCSKSVGSNLSYKFHHGIGLLIVLGFCGLNNSVARSHLYLRSNIESRVHSGIYLASTPSDYFRSRIDGYWSAVATWESSPDGVSWFAATEAPSSNATSITITAGTTVQVNSSVSLDQTIINGTLELQTGGILNIQDGIGDDIFISQNGILRVNTDNLYTNSILSNSSVIHIASGGKISIEPLAGKKKNGFEGFATSSNNVWESGSVFEYNGDAAFVITALPYFPNSREDQIPVFRVNRMAVQSVTSSTSTTINGIMEVNSSFTFKGSGQKIFRNGITGTATLTLDGSLGTTYITAPDAVLGGTGLSIILNNPLNMPNGARIPNSANLTISGASSLKNSGTFFIDGFLDATTATISNSATGIVIIKGTLKTSHAAGLFDKNISACIYKGTVFLNSGSTIEYDGADQSVTGTATLGQPYSNIIFSGTGIKTTANSIDISSSGSVKITGAAVVDATHNLGSGTGEKFYMDGGRLILRTGGDQPLMNGDFKITDGVIEFAASSSQTIRGATYQNIEVSGMNVANSKGNIYLNNSGTFTVKSGGVFTMNDNSIIAADYTNGQKVTVESGALFRCGNNEGFNGFTSTQYRFSSIHSSITNITLQEGSSVEYSRSDPPLTVGDQPITNSNGLVYQNLILSGTGNKSAPKGDLLIKGNFTKASTCDFLHNDGTVIFSGNGEQTISSNGSEPVFYNFTNKSVSLNVNNNVSVANQFLLGNNSKINLNADVSLLSRRNRTAFVVPIPINATIQYNAGRFIVERFINTGTDNQSHSKSWQFLSTPAFGESIRDTWQEKGDALISGYGTWITDALGVTKGFDAVSLSPSMKYYDPMSNSWIGVSSTYDQLQNEKGYMLFVRGDRLATSVTSPSVSTILRTRGKLFSPAPECLPPVIDVPAHQFQSVGNPYASSIDFSKITLSSGIGESYAVWDPTLGGDYGYGRYQTISSAIGFRAIPGGSANYNAGTDYRDISSGQAFFVFNTSDLPGSVSFSEDCKSGNTGHLATRMGAMKPSVIFANLYTQDGILTDGNAIAFSEEFSNKTDKKDALKLNNATENFGIKNEGKIFAVEARAPLSAGDTIFFEINHLTKQNYRISFIPEQFSCPYGLTLFDQYLQKSIPISFTDTTFVELSITSDKASAAANRLMLLTGPEAAPLAVSFIYFQAYLNEKTVLIKWKMGHQTSVDHYEIERSVDGITFSKIAEIPSNGMNSYVQIDANPFEGNNYYRIKTIEKTQLEAYSNIAKVFVGTSKSEIIVLPFSSFSNEINLKFINQQQGKYFVKVLNSSGQRIASKSIFHAGGSSIQHLAVDKKIPFGIYHILITSADGKNMILKMMR